jgi:hypothetical protein
MSDKRCGNCDFAQSGKLITGKVEIPVLECHCSPPPTAYFSNGIPIRCWPVVDVQDFACKEHKEQSVRDASES